jgi:hypothetical protein
MRNCVWRQTINKLFGNTLDMPVIVRTCEWKKTTGSFRQRWWVKVKETLKLFLTSVPDGEDTRLNWVFNK